MSVYFDLVEISIFTMFFEMPFLDIYSNGFIFLSPKVFSIFYDKQQIQLHKSKSRNCCLLNTVIGCGIMVVML